MTSPYIYEYRSTFKIARDLEGGAQQFWAAKRGEWVGAGSGNWRTRSKFRTRAAAELELVRIRHHLTPDFPRARLREIEASDRAVLAGDLRKETA